MRRYFNLWMKKSNLESGQIDRLSDGLNSNLLIIGWSNADLLDPKMTKAGFYGEMAQAYDGYEGVTMTVRRAASWGSIMWRFVRDMSQGDLVAVPAKDVFYLARVAGPCEENVAEATLDMRYRRKCTWLNERKPISRDQVSQRFQARLSSRQTCVETPELADEFERLVS